MTVVLIVLWFAKVADYVCGGSRQVHYLAQYYAMKHYYLQRLVHSKDDLGGETVQLKKRKADDPPKFYAKVWRSYPDPQDCEVGSGELRWEEYNSLDKGFKADTSRFSPREKALAFEIAQERLRSYLHNLEVTERRISHLKYEMACCNQTKVSATGKTLVYVHHWPQDKMDDKNCRDVEHAFDSAELRFVASELETETSSLLLLRRQIDVQFGALKLIENLENVNVSLDDALCYTRRMISFTPGSCCICVKPMLEVGANGGSRND